MESNQRALQILSRLRKLYPNTETTLKNWEGVDWKLVMCVVMSAQTTDKQVNKVTKKLFKKFPTLESFANANIEDLAKSINSIGFYRNKARFLKDLAQTILKDYEGAVPMDIDEMQKLLGVGRKTANVVTGVLSEENFGIAVDTHVRRLSRKLGLTKHKEPKNIENDLVKIFPQKSWNEISLLLIMHGRSVCFSRNPQCNDCVLKDLCNYPKKNE